MKRLSAGAAGTTPMADSDDSVQHARTRARQRLIGAVVLVVAGVVGFSMLLGGAPRPMGNDIPVEIARHRDAAPAAAQPAAPNASRQSPSSTGDTAALPPGVTTDTPVSDPAPAATASASAAAPSPAPKPVVVAAAPRPAAPPKPAEPRPAERTPEPKPTTAKPADSARAQALLEGKEASGRFVVQVGAFADNAAAGEARRKVEKLGLKTFTQKVNTSAGSRVRVRVGPFSSRGEADRAAGKIKSAGLPSAVMPL